MPEQSQQSEQGAQSQGASRQNENCERAHRRTNNTSRTIDTATGKEAPAEISSTRVYQIFSSIAQQYEKFNAVSSLGTYRRWLKSMTELAPITHESRVLDLAGGTGDVAFSIACIKRPAHIQITDLVPEMLEVAKRHHVEGAGCGVSISFEVVDAQNIPYEDESYDVVTMAYGIRNMPDRAAALSEVHRVLKPGGTFVCLEFSTPHNPLWRALYYAYLKFMIPFWGKLITGDREGFVYLVNSIRAFPKQQDFAESLRQAGFADVSWKNLSGGIAAIHIATK